MGYSHTIPIFEGFSIAHAINRINLAGRHITEYLIKLLYEKNYIAISSSQREIVKDIKEKLAYIAIDFDSELASSKILSSDISKTYHLPDGNIIKLEDQHFRCAELLFRPSLDGKDLKGVHCIVDKSIKESDVDIRRALYENILLSGGTTMMVGMQERLDKEMAFMAPSAIKCQVIALPQRQYLPYAGGMVLASLSGLNDKWVTKQEYEEFGSKIMHIKCI